MAFTFTKLSEDPVTGVETLTASTNTASAAGSFYCGFKPRYINVYQATTPAQYEYFDTMAAGYMKKVTAAGTMTTETTNGITVAASVSVTPGDGPWLITLGTGLHTNSASFYITLFK